MDDQIFILYGTIAGGLPDVIGPFVSVDTAEAWAHAAGLTENAWYIIYPTDPVEYADIRIDP